MQTSVAHGTTHGQPEANGKAVIIGNEGRYAVGAGNGEENVLQTTVVSLKQGKRTPNPIGFQVREQGLVKRGNKTQNQTFHSFPEARFLTGLLTAKTKG